MKKFSDLLKSTKASYDIVKSNLAPEILLSDEKIEGLTDAQFAGPNRTFPVPDQAHKDAYLNALKQFEGSEACQTIVDAINGLAIADNQPEDNSADPAAATVNPPATDDTNPQNDSAPNPMQAIVDTLVADGNLDAIIALFTDEQLKSFIDKVYQIGIAKGLITVPAEDLEAKNDDLSAKNTILAAQLDSAKKLAGEMKDKLASMSDTMKNLLLAEIAVMRTAAGNDGSTVDLADKSLEGIRVLYDEYKKMGGKTVVPNSMNDPDSENTDATNAAYEAELAEARRTACKLEVDSASGPKMAAEWLRNKVASLKQKYNIK